MRPPQRPAASGATIVARSKATLDDLARYLEDSGIAAHAVECAESDRVEQRSCAVVLFPDDFEDGNVLTFVRTLRRTRPRVLLIIVTREPNRLEPVLERDERSLAPVVLPKPSFGWSLVDLIRAHRATQLT